LLANAAAITAVVPATRIMAGDLPLNTVLPAIAVTEISSVPLNMIRVNESPKMHTERVQVSVLCKASEIKPPPPGTGYPGVKALLKLVLAACPSQRGTVNGVAVDSIVPDTEGPDLSDDATALYSQSRDFIVKYLA
jgi:hypothetical protein